MFKNLNSLFVTMFGLGRIRFIPGTFGSLVTVIILYFLFHILKIPSNFILLGLITIFVYSFFAINSHIEDNENKDPNEIIMTTSNTESCFTPLLPANLSVSSTTVNIITVRNITSKRNLKGKSLNNNRLHSNISSMVSE